VVAENLDGTLFSTVPTEKTILNRLALKDEAETDLFLEEIEIDSISPTGCRAKAKTDSYHYVPNSQVVFTYHEPYHFRINDFFPNIDVNVAVKTGELPLPEVCPEVISAYDLSLNYHDIPFVGNCSDQENHFY
jgi:hypothetical protein